MLNLSTAKGGVENDNMTETSVIAESMDGTNGGAV